MPSDTPSSAMFWTGWVVSGFVVLFLIFDGVTKVLKVVPVVEACQRFGLTPNVIVGIGTLLLACTALYALPQTAVVGALLLKHQPHRLDVVARKTPVALGVQIAE